MPRALPVAATKTWVRTVTQTITAAGVAAAALQHPLIGRYLRAHRPFLLEHCALLPTPPRGAVGIAAAVRGTPIFAAAAAGAATASGVAGVPGLRDALAAPGAALRLAQTGALEILQRCVATTAAAAATAASGVDGRQRTAGAAHGRIGPAAGSGIAAHALPLCSAEVPALVQAACIILTAWQAATPAATAAGAPVVAAVRAPAPCGAGSVADAPLSVRRLRALEAALASVHCCALEEAGRRRVAALVAECSRRGLFRLGEVLAYWIPRDLRARQALPPAAHWGLLLADGDAAEAALPAAAAVGSGSAAVSTRGGRGVGADVKTEVEASSQPAGGAGSVAVVATVLPPPLTGTGEPDASVADGDRHTLGPHSVLLWPLLAVAAAQLRAGTDSDSPPEREPEPAAPAPTSGRGGRSTRRNAAQPAAAVMPSIPEGAVAAPNNTPSLASADSQATPAPQMRPFEGWRLPLRVHWDPVLSAMVPAGVAGLNAPYVLQGLLQPSVAADVDGANVATTAPAGAISQQPPAGTAAAPGVGSIAAAGEPPAARQALRYTDMQTGQPLLACLQQYVVTGACRTLLGQTLFAPSSVLQYATALATILATQPLVPSNHKEAQDPASGLPYGYLLACGLAGPVGGFPAQSPGPVARSHASASR
jgi:hypothetical protein